MFAVNQQGKDSYLGNTQVFCRETNHKKGPGIFQLQIWAEGIFLYLSWKSCQKKGQENFNLNLELILLLILTSHARCLFPHRVGAEPHLKWRMVNINYMVMLNMWAEEKRTRFYLPCLEPFGPNWPVGRKLKNLRQGKPWKLEKGGVVAAKQIQNAHCTASHTIFQRKDSIPFPTTTNSNYHRLIMKTFLWFSRIYKTGFL